MENIFVLILLPIILIFSVSRKMFFGRTDASSSGVLPPGRIGFFDFIKGIAILAVILIHTEYFFDNFYGHNNAVFLRLADSLGRFAIPVFLISSGVLLNPNFGAGGLKEFYRRKIIRIIIPYIAASSLFFVVFHFPAKEIFYSLVAGKTQVPYYFVIILIQFYLLFPLLIKFKDKKYFLSAAFAVSLFSFFIPQTWHFFGVPVFLQYLYFFAYGISRRDYFLNYGKGAVSRAEFVLWILIILFYTFVAAGFQADFHNARYFFGLAVFNLLFYFKDFLFQSGAVGKIITACGRLGLWIFLWHFFILSLFYRGLNDFFKNYYFNFFAIFFLTAAFALAFAFVSAYVYGLADSGRKYAKIR